MADNIRIDIPGLPNSLPQWATEETLKDIATQLGAKRSGVNSLDVETKKAAKSTGELSKAQKAAKAGLEAVASTCLLYTSPSPRDQRGSRMPSSA